MQFNATCFPVKVELDIGHSHRPGTWAIECSRRSAAAWSGLHTPVSSLCNWKHMKPQKHVLPVFNSILITSNIRNVDLRQLFSPKCFIRKSNAIFSFVNLNFSVVSGRNLINQLYFHSNFTIKQGVPYSHLLITASNDYGSTSVQINSDYTYIKNESRHTLIYY